MLHGDIRPTILIGRAHNQVPSLTLDPPLSCNGNEHRPTVIASHVGTLKHGSGLEPVMHSTDDQIYLKNTVK